MTTATASSIQADVNAALKGFFAIHDDKDFQGVMRTPMTKYAWRHAKKFGTVNAAALEYAYMKGCHSGHPRKFIAETEPVKASLYDVAA